MDKTGTEPAPAARSSVLREVHLRDYWKIVWQGRWTILALFALVLVGTAVWTFMQVPVYRATAIVEVQPKARGVLGNQDVAGLGATGLGWLAEEKYHNTQFEIIKSRDVARRVVKLLDLDAHPRFEHAADPVEAFRGLIRVTPRRDTGLIEIAIEGTDPHEIASWANAVAHAYVARNFEKASENVAQAVTSVRAQMAGLERDLAVADSQRIAALESTGIFDSENRAQVLSQTLADYNQELSRLEIELAGLRSTLQKVTEVRDRDGDLLSIPELGADEVLQDLYRSKLTAEQELERLRVDLGPAHPALQARGREIRQVELRIDDRVAALLGALQNRFELAVQQARQLGQQVQRTESEAIELARASSEVEVAQTQAETKKRIFDLITKTVDELSLGAELMTNNVQVLDEAIPPRFPIKPRTRMNLLVGAMMGLFLGFGTVFFLEYLDNTIRTPEDVEKYLGASVLGVIPKMQEQGLAARAVREAYQSLRTSIIFSSKNRQRRILLVTSTGPQEGKSSSVANLGRTLAAAGERVVIVDCDLRRPTQHLHHGLDRESGLTNYLAAPVQELDWSGYVKSADPASLHVLTCGPIPPNPPELLGGDRFRNMLAEMRERYDWVIVDSPPASSLADASLLASLAELVVLVVQYNRTDRDLVVKTLQQIRSVNAALAGVVLNNVDLERTYHKDYYYAGYYYYTEEEEKGSRGKRPQRRAQTG